MLLILNLHHLQEHFRPFVRHIKQKQRFASDGRGICALRIVGSLFLSERFKAPKVCAVRISVTT